MATAARGGIATLATAIAHRTGVLPVVHSEIEGWRRAAEEIPDVTLRREALAALVDKAANPEATAALATLAPRQTRRAVIRASTALQVAIDYLDNLDEEGGPDSLRDGLQMHLALGIAVTPGAKPADWYLHHAQQRDGGYLDRLVAVCQENVGNLPSQEAVLPAARRAAERCAEGQSRTHAAVGADSGELEAWSLALGAAGDFNWWEAAAGASSSIAAHALIALAGSDDSTAAQAEAVDAAYFPAIGALTVVLDDLVDREADAAAGEHSYLSYYASTEAAAQRLAAIAAGARADTEGLPGAARHGAILSAVIAYYLSSPRIGGAVSSTARRQLLDASGPATRPLAAVLRLHRDD